jgi:hypothetical protein
MPVAATLAADEPWMVPIRPLAITPTLAGPPGVWPAIASARLANSLVVPDLLRNAPNRMNR